ncbi:probable nicotinate-nucleotide adenylyltransferase [Clostridium sp. CAG:349]|nr:probable nicotinate-nucleotide adenylyltransferase [Clostridium sp. CAG:349]
MAKTIVFGGSFDPVHVEHTNILKAAVRELCADKVIVVPTKNPPHKSASKTPFSDRSEMARIAFSQVSANVIVDDIENRNDGVNYSSDNLPVLEKKYGKFVYVIGGDSLLALESWHEPEFIVRNFEIAVFDREGYQSAKDKAAELNEKWNGKIRILEHVGKEVDSHTIRDRLMLKADVSGLDENVERYIKSRNLYSEFFPYVDKAATYLDAKRLVHSKNTALVALSLNRNFCPKIDEDKLLLAGLLHDVGKMYDKTELPNNIKNVIPKDSIGTPVQHQFVSAEIVKNDFHISDEDVLNAIRFHTTGRENMSRFEKLIYVSDLISYERNFQGVESLRKAVYNDFEKGFITCLTYSRDYVVETGREVYPLTDKAISFYKENL